MSKITEKFVLVNEIDWDEGHTGLPKEEKFLIDFDGMTDNDYIEELIADTISNEYGYCVNSFSYEIINN